MIIRAVFRCRGGLLLAPHQSSVLPSSSDECIVDVYTDDPFRTKSLCCMIRTVKMSFRDKDKNGHGINTDLASYYAFVATNI